MDIYIFIGKLDMFSLICVADKVWIIELTLIHKNIRSVHNWTRMHMFIYQSDAKHIMTSPIKIITSVQAYKILSTYTCIVILRIIMYTNRYKRYIITDKKNTGAFVSDTDFLKDITQPANIISLRKSVSETKSPIFYIY